MELNQKKIITTNIYNSKSLKNKEISIIQYTLKKNIVQNKKKYTESIANFFSTKTKKSEQKKNVQKYNTIIGSDETLKGDTFGGIIIAAVKADKDLRAKLEKIGVKDSKLIKDDDIIELAPKIKEILGKDNYHIYEKTPKEYNQENCLTLLLNKMHTHALSTLGTADLIIIDQYPGARINLKNAKTETKAESNYTEVAAASIIARERGLAQFDRLSEQAGFKLPKGSTHVKEALARIKKENKDPTLFVKMHFRNVQKVFG